MVEVIVNNWAIVARWYVEVLGLKPIQEDREGRFTLLEAGPGRLALKEGLRSGDRMEARLVFRVGDVDQSRARLLALGVEVGEPSESTEGYREIRLSDPEGTPIRLFSWSEVARALPLDRVASV